jgi:hypothetical protein
MRLELRVSGGVAGISRPPISVDTSELPAGDAAELEALAQRVAAAPSRAEPPGPDRFQYDLRIDGRELRMHEGALSPEAAELIRRMRG